MIPWQTMPQVSDNPPIVLGLDLGATSAWCLGRRGERPDSGTMALPFDIDEPAGFSALYRNLAEITEGRRPRIVAVEQRQTSQVRRKGRQPTTNDKALKRLYGLHAIACMFAANCGARLQESHVASIRKACVPTVPIGDRGKPAIHAWAVRQGFCDASVIEDQTDAIAIWAHTVGWYGDRI